MGGRLSKKIHKLDCTKFSSGDTVQSSHSSYCQQNAAMVWSTFLRSSSMKDEGLLQLNEMMVDGSFMECLLELAKEQQQQTATRQHQGAQSLLRSLVFYDCYFNLTDHRTLSAMAEFVSLNRLRAFELWDGEVPISPASLSSLLHVLAHSAADSLDRLRLNATFRGQQVGQRLASVLQQCSKLSHLEMVGCTMDLSCVQHLSQGLGGDNHHHHPCTISQVVLDSCQLDDEMLESLLEGLVECFALENVVITGNDGLTHASLGPLTVLLRRHRQRHKQQQWQTRGSRGLQQVSLHNNRNLFSNCTFQEARQFFSAYIEQQQNSTGCNKELFLCQMGIDNTAAACLFQVLETNHATVERLDLRFNPFDSSRPSSSCPCWLDSLPKLQHLKTLYLPSNLQFCSVLHGAMLRNTSLTTCSYSSSEESESGDDSMIEHIQLSDPLDFGSMASNNNNNNNGMAARSKAEILTRNKTLNLVQDVLASRLTLALYPVIMSMVDTNRNEQKFECFPYSGGVENDEPPTALFQLIKGKSTELAATAQHHRLADF